MWQWFYLFLHLCSPLCLKDILPDTTYNQHTICFLFLLLAVVPLLVQPVANTIKGFYIKKADLIIDDKYVLMDLMPKVSIGISKRVRHLHLQPSKLESTSSVNSKNAHIPPHQSAQNHNTS